MCVCVGTETRILPVPRPEGLFAATALPRLAVAAGQPAACQQRYTGSFLGINAGKLVDAFHFVSAGAGSFARGLHDTPKIEAPLLLAKELNIQCGLPAVAPWMTLGGFLTV